MIHPLTSAHAALRDFLETHREALQNAALLLGGRPGLRRTQRLLDELGTQPTLTRRLRRELQALRALLSLEHVDHLERPEAGHFALVDPDWCNIAEICLLDEALVSCFEDLDAETAAGAPLRSAACAVRTAEKKPHTNPSQRAGWHGTKEKLGHVTRHKSRIIYPT